MQSVQSFWEAMITALLLRGNALAMITRDDDSRVRALWYLNPDRVAIEVTKTGRLRYRVANPDGSSTLIPAEGMVHIPGPLSFDGYTGRSVISTFRETLGLGLALERYGSEFFANGATPIGAIRHPGALPTTAQDKIKKSVEEFHTGRGKRHRLLVLEENMAYEALGMSHEDSQFIEAKRFTTEEIARIFGVPPWMIGGDVKGSMTYSNSETQALNLLKFTIGPWLARIESAVNFSCISPLERRQLYCEFLSDALLSSDTASRYNAYQIGVKGGWLTIDEVRRKERRH